MFMKRNAEDEYAAMLMADAMESEGATVVAITPNGESVYPGALEPHIRYIIWVRIENKNQCDAIDAAIERTLSSQ